jgi:hypothetical protein
MVRASASVVVVTVAVALASPAAAISSYQSHIPNGTKNGCRTCHVSAFGANPWNDFGKDVLRQDPDVTEADLAGATGQNRNYNQTPSWDVALCQLDSDGDGQSNGQELGDPNCEWIFATPAVHPARTTDISNPGDASSTSARPDDVDPGEGEGEGGVVGEGEGEGEGEGQPPPPGGCCNATGAAEMPFALFALPLFFLRGGRRRALSGGPS